MLKRAYFLLILFFIVFSLYAVENREESQFAAEKSDVLYISLNSDFAQNDAVQLELYAKSTTDYVLEYNYIDFAGNSMPEIDKEDVIFDTKIAPVIFNLSETHISPNGDGEKDKAILTFGYHDFQGIERWEVNLSDSSEDGNKKVVYKGDDLGVFEAVFDGIDSNGKAIPDGEYYVNFITYYTNGIIVSHGKKIYIDRSSAVAKNGKEGTVAPEKASEGKKDSTSADMLAKSDAKDAKDTKELDAMLIKKEGKYYIATDDIIFAAYKTELDSAGKEREGANLASIKRVADFYKKYPNYTIILEGNALNVLLGVGSEREKKEEDILVKVVDGRINSVKNALIKAGIPEADIKAVNNGGKKPLVPVDNLKERWKDRRVIFRVEAKNEPKK